MSEVVQVLMRARDLYAEAPSHASRHHAPKYGTHCIITAITATAVEWPYGYRSQARHLMYKAINNESLIDYNAKHTTEEVVEAFNRAIVIGASDE